MTEETKTCECKEKALKVIKDICVIASGVFVGATLAILLSAQILTPKCPCQRGMMMPPSPGIHRQLPPPMMHHRYHHRANFKRPPRGEFHRQQPDDNFAPPHKDFNRHKPERPTTPPAKK